MYYAAIAFLAFTINIILNWNSFKNAWKKTDASDTKKLSQIRYGHFLLASNCFFLSETCWGIIYDHHDVPELFPIIYSITVFYFLFMLLSMLTWARYIVAYLNKGSFRSKILTIGAWIMFLLGIGSLMVNRFYHFIFSYNEAHEYIPEKGSLVTFIFVLAFYAVLSVYMLLTAYKSKGSQKLRYMAVAYTSMALGIFMFLQILTSFLPLYVIGLLIAICIVHSYVEAGEKKEKEIQDHITSIMAEDYEAIYYFDIETGEYIQFSRSQKYSFLDVTYIGKDFYKESLDNIEKTVHPDDKEYARSLFNKEAMIKNLEGKRSFSYKYRLMVDGYPRYFLFTYRGAGDDKHIILYEKDIDDELMAEKKLHENQEKSITFSRIAESLAANYDAIYYVDAVDSSYVSFVANDIFGQLQVSQLGKEFFEECYSNIPKVIHEQDRNRVVEFLDRDKMITALDNHRSYSIEYRLLVAGGFKYLRMIARRSSDRSHFIICVENIDDEVRREKQRLKELKTEKELARRDELTGIKNKYAYKELEETIQGNMDHGLDYLPYALIVCDANDLKKINDTMGHVAGDEYLKAAAKLLCYTFVHSPVFRIGGDEFAVFLRGNDYYKRNELMEKLRNQVLENQKAGNGVVLASGISEYNPKTDTVVSEVFERADKAMYENKRKLKGQ